MFVVTAVYYYHKNSIYFVSTNELLYYKMRPFLVQNENYISTGQH
jgi:hypothetical protein